MSEATIVLQECDLVTENTLLQLSGKDFFIEKIYFESFICCFLEISDKSNTFQDEPTAEQQPCCSKENFAIGMSSNINIYIYKFVSI